MISRIWWDNDHCLSFSEEKSENFDFGFRLESGEIFYTKVNPCSYPLLDFSRKLVGPENVWMLTSAARDYALAINSHASFKFPENQIVAREELNLIVENSRWNPDFKNPYKDSNSVLIDNLPPRYNEEKLICLGIKLDNLDRYCKVGDYCGQENWDFEEEVMEFLNRKHNE